MAESASFFNFFLLGSLPGLLRLIGHCVIGIPQKRRMSAPQQREREKSEVRTYKRKGEKIYIYSYPIHLKMMKYIRRTGMDMAEYQTGALCLYRILPSYKTAVYTYAMTVIIASSFFFSYTYIPHCIEICYTKHFGQTEKNRRRKQLLLYVSFSL
jgi:hypothetical protein